MTTRGEYPCKVKRRKEDGRGTWGDLGTSTLPFPEMAVTSGRREGGKSPKSPKSPFLRSARDGRFWPVKQTHPSLAIMLIAKP